MEQEKTRLEAQNTFRPGDNYPSLIIYIYLTLNLVPSGRITKTWS